MIAIKKVMRDFFGALEEFFVMCGYFAAMLRDLIGI